MVSDFRKKKLQHVFNTFFDVDKTGSLDKEDFKVIIAKHAEKRKYQPGDAKYKKVEETLLNVWEALLSQNDDDKDGKVDFGEWVAACEEYGKNPANTKWASLYAKLVFETMDAGNDGSIDVDEYVETMSDSGLDKDESKKAFEKLSGGKSVTWDQFEKLWVEYFASDDVNAKGNYIFGKLSY